MKRRPLEELQGMEKTIELREVKNRIAQKADEKGESLTDKILIGIQEFVTDEQVKTYVVNMAVKYNPFPLPRFVTRKATGLLWEVIEGVIVDLLNGLRNA